MKRSISFFSLLCLVFALILTVCACTSKGTTDDKEAPGESTPESIPGESVTDPNPDLPAGAITFNGGSVDVGSTGATFENGILTITKAGSYELTGKSETCGIVVNVDKSEQVELILAGVELTNPVGPVVFCDSAEKLLLTAK